MYSVYTKYRTLFAAITAVLYLIIAAAGCKEPYFERIFEKKTVTYTITVTEMEGGSVTINPVKAAYTKGEFVTVTAKADTAHRFNRWKGSLTGTENPCVLKMQEPITIIADFTAIPQYTLKAVASEGGKVLNSEGEKTKYLEHERCTLTAQAEAGYEFVRWEGDVSSTSDKLYLTFDKNYQIHARFKPNDAVYTVDITQSGTGSIIRSSTKPRYVHNEELTLKAQAAEGWKFKQWSSGVSGEKKYEEEITVRIDGHKSISAEFVKRQWTFVVYMAADNDLEAAAMLDMNELEAAEWNGKTVDMLVLLDRHPGYDASDGDWHGTRLYEVRQDTNGINNTVISKRLSCGILGLSSESESELDMSRKEVLSGLLEYAKEEYLADRYGLIIWGHGTGWRGSGSSGGVKGIGIDASSGNGEMKISELAEAVRGKGIKVIGFDTCFGGIAEVFYELEGLCEYGIGSSGATPSSGWDYRDVFNRFFASGLSERAFCDAVTESYQKQYRGTPGADIVVCDIGKIGGIVAAWEDFSRVVSSSIDSRQKAELVRQIVLKESITYRFSRYPSDVYVDMKDSARLMKEKAGELTADSTVQQQIRQNAAKVEEAVERAVTGWIAEKGEGGHLGIYIAPMGSAETVAGVHDAGYVRGSGELGQGKLVKESEYWAVQESKNKSVLDKLFYHYR